jgi:molybdopterin-guanine dinucleotide biosynthesis protein A
MGKDKAFLKDKEGRFLLSLTAKELEKHFDEVVFITDKSDKFKNIPELAVYRTVEDMFPLQGPLGAITTALVNFCGQAVFVMAGDMPQASLDVIEGLSLMFESQASDVALPRHQGKMEPLYAIYGAKAEYVFREALKEGRLAIRDSFPFLKVSFLDLEDNDLMPRLFMNMNTPEEAEEMNFRVF